MEQSSNSCSSNAVDYDGNELPSSPPAITDIMQDQGIKVGSHQNPIFSSGFCPPDRVVEGFKNFKKSGAPSRLLCFKNGSWVDLARETFDELREGFVSGKTAVEVSEEGNQYLFDFLRMLRVDLEMGARNSVAWIDVDGQCFFPKLVVEGRENVSVPELSIVVRNETMPSSFPDTKRDLRCPPKEKTGTRNSDQWIDVNVPNNFSIVPRNETKPSSTTSNSPNKNRILHCQPEEKSDECSASSTAGLDHPRWPNTTILRVGDRYYKNVENAFMLGIKRFAPHTEITSISKCSNLPSESFLAEGLRKKRVRGEANVRWGWYAAPLEVIAGVLVHGFDQGKTQCLGPCKLGCGIHLSSFNYPFGSSLLVQPDVFGERHMILCQAIMGKSEKVSEGSTQFLPSCDQFDSGVDDLEKPRWYIVWTAHMNTHLRPLYVVSFKSSKHDQGPLKMMGASSKLSRGDLLARKLLQEISKLLPSPKRETLLLQYTKMKAGKINKQKFLTSMRAIAGDQLLSSVVMKIKRQMIA